MPSFRISSKKLRVTLRSLQLWTKSGFKDNVAKAGKVIARTYKSQIERGLDGAGKPMTKVKDVTMEMPIRFSSDRAIRGDVRSSKTPLFARGRTAGSIKSSRKVDRIEIAPNTRHGRIVLGQNANRAATKRDPLIVSDIQINIIEREVIKGIEEAIRR